MDDPAQQLIDLVQEYGWEFLIGMLVLVGIGLLLSISEKKPNHHHNDDDKPKPPPA